MQKIEHYHANGWVYSYGGVWIGQHSQWGQDEPVKVYPVGQAILQLALHLEVGTGVAVGLHSQNGHFEPVKVYPGKHAISQLAEQDKVEVGVGARVISGFGGLVITGSATHSESEMAQTRVRAVRRSMVLDRG